MTEKEAGKILTTIRTQWHYIAADCELGRAAQSEMAQAFALCDQIR